MNIITKLKESRIFLWLVAAGGISVLAQLTMVTNEVWGGHGCHLVIPEKIQ